MSQLGVHYRPFVCSSPRRHIERSALREQTIATPVLRPSAAHQRTNMNAHASSPIHTRTLPRSGTRPDEAESKCAPTPTRPRTQERSAPLAPRAVASQIDPGHSLRPKRSSFDHPEAISPRCTDLAPGVLGNGLDKATLHLDAPSHPPPRRPYPSRYDTSHRGGRPIQDADGPFHRREPAVYHPIEQSAPPPRRGGPGAWPCAASSGGCIDCGRSQHTHRRAAASGLDRVDHAPLAGRLI